MLSLLVPRLRRSYFISAVHKMRRLALLVILVAIWPREAVTTLSAGRGHHLAGGQEPLVDLKDEYAVSAAQAALTELNWKSNSQNKMVLVEITKGTTQVR